MSLQQQVTELCLTISLFEQHVQSAKKQLFTIPTLTMPLLWNTISDGNTPLLNKNILLNFANKHQIALTARHCHLITTVYSSRKNGTLTPLDLWQILRPLHIPHTLQVLHHRQHKTPVTTHQSHYLITDLISDILSATAHFLATAETMKQHILEAGCKERLGIELQQPDPPHLQAYLHKYAPHLTLPEVKIIHQHIVRNESPTQKTIVEFLLPADIPAPTFNPHFTHQSTTAEETDNLSLFYQHQQSANRVGKPKSNLPSYVRSAHK